ncbi:hypothetical protein [Halocatena marina]|uniref:hypothetical protein n=1 Tax=Halocatena marina TaxID=2934937 RepID=UPI00200C0600|nr:hypothetical protein [Halocatena marina]
MATDEEIKVKIMRKLVRGGYVGKRKVTVDTAKGWVASHDEGRAEELIRDWITEPGSPLEAYGGGARDNIRLSSKAEGMRWLEAHDVDTTFL